MQADFLIRSKAIHTSSRKELALAYSCLTATAQTAATYHDRLEATIRLRSAHGQTSKQIAQVFSESGNFPLTVSYIEAQLKKIASGCIDAFKCDLYPEDVERASGGASSSEMRQRKTAGWNMHVDIAVSVIHANDAGVRDKVQKACGLSRLLRWSG